jgi:hypothetical protein
VAGADLTVFQNSLFECLHKCLHFIKMIPLGK